MDFGVLGGHRRYSSVIGTAVIRPEAGGTECRQEASL